MDIVFFDQGNFDFLSLSMAKGVFNNFLVN